MIARLRGVVDSLGEDWAVVDVGGVGYLVSCSGRTLARLSAGAEVVLLVDTWVREDAIQLYGFVDAGEREWFRMLTTVQGVGAKVALAILTVAAPETVLQAIAAQDKAVLTRAAGVGPKLAARILAELKDKAGKVALGSAGGTAAAVAAAAPIGSGMLEDAVSALVNLGYRRLEAFEAAGAAARELGEGADASAIIRTALRRLGKEMVR